MYVHPEVLRHRPSVGDILAFIQYTRLFNQPIFQVAQVSNMLQTTMAAAERVFELLSEPEEKNEARLPAPEGGFTGNVTFNRVRFGYNPEKPVIRDFSVDIGAGRKVQRRSDGAGKTTVVSCSCVFTTMRRDSHRRARHQVV